MQITECEVENFGCIEHFESCFQPGLNLILGPNGSGKSTLLDAIFITLYAEPFPERDQTIRQGTSRGTIRLQINANGRNYTLIREFSLTQSSAKLIPDSGEPVSGLAKVRSYLVSEVMHMPPGFMPWYLRQGEIQTFANVLADESLDMLNLLGIGKISGLKPYIDNALRQEFGSIEADYVQASSFAAGIQARIQTMQDELARLQEAEIARNKIDINRRMQYLTSVVSAYEITSKLQELIDKRRAVTDELTAINEKIKEIASERAKHEAILCELAQALGVTDLDEAARAYFTVQNQKKHAAQLVVNMTNLRHTFLTYFRSRQPPVGRKLTDLSTAIALAESKLSDYRKVGVLQTAVEGFCPFCGQQLNMEEIARMRNEYHELDNKYRLMLTVKQQYSGQHAARQSLRKVCRDILMQYRTLKNTYSEHSVEGTLPDIPEEVVNDSYKKYVDLGYKLHDLLGRVETLKKSIEQIDYSISELSKNDISILVGCTITRQQADEEIRQLIQQQANYNVQEQRYTTLTRQLEEAQLSYNTALENKARLWENVRIRRVCRGIVDKLEDLAPSIVLGYVLHSIVPLINTFLGNLRAPFVIRYTQGFVAEFDSSLPLPISRLSYGQKILLSLAASYAFYLNSLSRGILIADEPLAGLDAENSHSVVNFLHKLHDYSVDRQVQCIVSTHDVGDVPESSYNILRLC